MSVPLAPEEFEVELLRPLAIDYPVAAASVVAATRWVRASAAAAGWSATERGEPSAARSRA